MILDSDKTILDSSLEALLTPRLLRELGCKIIGENYSYTYPIVWNYIFNNKEVEFYTVETVMYERYKDRTITVQFNPHVYMHSFRYEYNEAITLKEFIFKSNEKTILPSVK